LSPPWPTAPPAPGRPPDRHAEPAPAWAHTRGGRLLHRLTGTVMPDRAHGNQWTWTARAACGRRHGAWTTPRLRRARTMRRCGGCCGAVGLPAGRGDPAVAAALTPEERAADAAYPAPWTPPAGRAVLQPDLAAAAALLDAPAVDVDAHVNHALTTELPGMPVVATMEELRRLPAVGTCACGWQANEPCDKSLHQYPEKTHEERRALAALHAAHRGHLLEVGAGLAATHRRVRLVLYQVRTINVDVWLPDAAAEQVAAKAAHVELDVDQAPVEIGELFYLTPAGDEWDLESWGVAAGGIADADAAGAEVWGRPGYPAGAP
jgi:hypothetical protein